MKPPFSDTDAAAISRASASLDPLEKTNSGGNAPDQAGPSDPPGGTGRPVPPVPLPAQEAITLGQSLVELTDSYAVRLFGPQGKMSPPLAEQAAIAWGRVVEQYLPTLANSGPLGQLALVYSLHLSGCIMHSKQSLAITPPCGNGTAASFPGSSENADTEKLPSSVS